MVNIKYINHFVTFQIKVPRKLTIKKNTVIAKKKSLFFTTSNADIIPFLKGKLHENTYYKNVVNNTGILKVQSLPNISSLSNLAQNQDVAQIHYHPSVANLYQI